jgi:glutathione peroxidase
MSESKTIYDFKVIDITGAEQTLEQYRGKVILIVNTASRCGFTSQYKELEELYEEYKDSGFTILAFPCNQFGEQESGDNKEIQTFCEVNYSIKFPIFSKIEVNGKNEAPLYSYLKSSLPGFLGSNIKWNFTKFLIGKDGVPFKRYGSITSPLKIKKDIEFLIKK